MSDPNGCPSCLHIGNIVRGIEFLNSLVPLPEPVHEAYRFFGHLFSGHLETSHAAWIGAGTVSTSASSDTGVTGVREVVIKVHPTELPNSD